MIDFKAKIDYDIGSDERVLLTRIKNNMTGELFTIIPTFQKKDFLTRSDTFIPIDFNFKEPALISNSQFVQGVLDAAWEAGFRPTGFKDIQNETVAIKCHLEDMRRLVFKDRF